jgi:hypothetical protein
MNAVVLRRTTIGYINFKPAGRFYEARRVAPDVVIGAFASTHEARQAIFADHRARQAERCKKPQHPVGTKPVFRGERLIGWISAGNGGFDAVLADGEVRGPFAAESSARKEINSAWGISRSKLPRSTAVQRGGVPNWSVLPFTATRRDRQSRPAPSRWSWLTPWCSP